MRTVKPSTARKLALGVFVIACVLIFPLNLGNNRVFLGAVIVCGILVVAAILYTDVTRKRLPFNPFF